MICSICGSSVDEDQVAYIAGSSYCEPCLMRHRGEDSRAREKLEALDRILLVGGTIIIGGLLSLIVIVVIGVAFWRWITMT
jgi:hypothetical protein